MVANTVSQKDIGGGVEGYNLLKIESDDFVLFFMFPQL